ncbi:nucleolar pre-ribosomal-associated protein 1 [Spodoptera litura]|uniref:Nucleolar pre-ribosomal-associated protein 1 n=1 Tax=Spodoptera litura TaxID=69820 RepID=A0A9J7E6C8_SPOLT|nr:nucleolar pre-ribosomal-associated protein 1 [Spodoptera litura]
MGKRKFESEKDKSPKKPKKAESESVENGTDEQPQNPVESDNKHAFTSKKDSFDVKYFRKELSAKQGQTMALTQFLQVCLNPDSPADYLLEYLKCGGNSHEILRQITADSKKNLTLATPAFHIFHLIIVKVQSSLPHMISITEEACRYFLNTFMSTIEIMISESSGPRHRKVVLKLLTSMVTLNSDLGVEVLNQAPLTPKHLQHVVEKPNFKEKDNVRTTFVHFMTSFLIEGHLPLIKALLEKQGLLALVIPGLINDEPEAVLIFLNILKKNVVDNALISKSLKLKTFSHQVLHNLFKVFSWKGPPELSQEVRNELRPDIMNLLSDILLTLFTSHKTGLYFIDNSLGTVDANKNQNLYKALLTLKRPWENETECEVILNIMYKCPDLHRALCSVIEQSFEPQHSPIWERTADFTIKLLNKLRPEDMVSRMTHLNPVQIANFVRFVTLPVPLLKFINISLGKDQTVSLYCVKVLVKMLQCLKRFLQILESKETAQTADLKNKLEYFIPKHLPTPATIVMLIENVTSGKIEVENTKDYRLPKISDTDALISLVDLLLLYNDIQPAYFETLEGSIDMKKILDFSKTLETGHIALLKFKIVSLWLTLDSSAISLKNPMFKELFLIMLDVYMSDEDETWIEAKDTLRIYFKNTAIFEGDEDEIHLILYTLRNARVNPSTLISDIVEYVLENITDLTEYVRNQLVHFEISSENTEDSLKKLFNDLMENKTTEDNVFLESRMPSPFIVGCMQYLQTHKDAKKSLKHFLSLYIVNLLHCNYSPELTEVLIGDCKLDARNYVASWIGQPVAISDTVVGQDNVLKSISSSIVDREEVSLKDVFLFLEEVTEDGDFVIDDVHYKFITSKIVDDSEMLMWAKYLIFCIVRLTNMGQLNEEQQKRITGYFQCIIEIGKKHLCVDVCRTIILTLFKNPQFLKIYKPLNTGKNSSNLYATEFLLQVLTHNLDIVNYLNNKHKLLNTYQQKNYNEITKAFIKINKRKNADSQYTTRVLENVGLSNEDDIKLLNLIFSVDTDACLRDDKEPSLVLELLRYLIEKYSETISLELQPNILKKTISLYTDLLSNKELNPNLTSLENALTKYFENKPHQALRVSEEDFKKFFYFNNLRKSTATLAAVLLKFNVKFCNVFKDEIVRPEILAQRELTLPLGSAVINHNQFLLDNKEFLATIYNEYKSNIIKMVEKPHKAGQIYVACWQFIRKLVIECMDVQDCLKLFNKTHKFETVECSHVQILQNVFLKIYENLAKKEHLLNYLSCMLNLATMALKENKIDALNEIITGVHSIAQICGIVEGLDTAQKDDFKKMTESAIWQNFCKATLKDSLKIKTVDQGYTIGPKLLALLTELVKLLYPDNHDDITTLFDMVTSHSEFLNVMLSLYSSDIKSRLIEFLYTLILKNKSVMKTQHIPVYLSAYHATRSPCDRLIVAILHFYETNGQPVNEYKPYVWGDSAANYYAVRKNRSSSLWSHPTPNQVLNLFDKEVIERTVRNFPVSQKFEYHYELKANIGVAREVTDSVRSVLNEMMDDGVLKPYVTKDGEGAVRNLVVKGKYEGIIAQYVGGDLLHSSNVDQDEGIYDPMFVFPLLSHLLAPGSVASCFKMLRSGLLSVPVMALSSHCPMMRAAAYHVLHRFCMLLETETRHKNDKLFLTDFINTLRRSLTSAITSSEPFEGQDMKNPKLPGIDALYLARALMVSTAPFDPLYKPVNNFLIAKNFVDCTLVPDFLSLFHDSDVEAIERRLWILEIIRDGTKTMTDIDVVFKTMCLKMIMDFYTSVLSDKKVKETILGALSSIVAVPRAFEILVEGHGLLSWLHSVVRQTSEKTLIKGIFRLINNMMYSMNIAALSRNIAAKNGIVNEFIELRTNKDVEQEILVIHYDLLKHLDDLEVEDAAYYVRICRLMSKRSIKSLSKKQMLSLVNKVGVWFKDNKVQEVTRLLSKALLASDALVLKSQNMTVDLDCEYKTILVNTLTEVVQMYVP